MNSTLRLLIGNILKNTIDRFYYYNLKIQKEKEEEIEQLKRKENSIEIEYKKLD